MKNEARVIIQNTSIKTPGSIDNYPLQVLQVLVTSLKPSVLLLLVRTSTTKVSLNIYIFILYFIL